MSDTAKTAPKVGGLVRGAGKILDRTKSLRPPVWPVFLSGTLKELIYGLFYAPPGDALMLLIWLRVLTLFLANFDYRFAIASVKKMDELSMRKL